MLEHSTIRKMLEEQWRQLNEADDKKYYALFFLRELENNKIAMLASRFPTYENLCSFHPEAETIEIDGNEIYIKDMRDFWNDISKALPCNCCIIYNENYPVIKNEQEISELFKKYYSFANAEKVDLTNLFTQKELTALAAIYDHIGKEGEISISALVRETGLSRPVFASLINTLSSTGSAEVVSRGVRGTSIKFLNPDIKKLVDKHKE